MKIKILLLVLFIIDLNIYAQTEFIDHTISVEFNSSMQTEQFNIASADIDGDGDMDVFTSSWASNVVSWFENMDGKGDFSTEKIISTNLDHGYSVITSDLDGDGDEDVVYASRDTDSIFWHINTDGNGTTGAQLALAFADGVKTIIAKDIDGDGDNDIIASLYYGNLVVWYENTDGLGDFSSQKIITADGFRFTSVFAADIDNDGCDNTDIAASNTKVTMDVGEFSTTTFTNSEGAYILLPPDEGSYSVHVDAPSSLFDSSPLEYNFDFNGNVKTENANFCLEPVKVINDVSMVLFNIGRVPVPGFNVKYQMFFRNNGTSVLNGIIVLQFNNSKLEFVSSTDPTSSQTASSLSFDFSNLNPFEGRFIDIVFKVFEPPITIADDILIFTAKITPVEGDDYQIDNEVYIGSPVLNSFDPNDIAVLEGEQILIEQIDEFLHYVIRFQNVGSIEATNVRVENVLDPNLEWNSFQTENISHQNSVEITNGNEVSFIFNDIFLADSTSNEPESHGYIAYKIKPKENITIGEVMNNNASIFFDFNAAVETNTVATEVTNAVFVGQNNSTNYSVFPVPATDFLQVSSKTNMSQILIYNYSGQLILSQNVNSSANNKTISISNLEPGLYFLEIKDENEARGIKKIIKNSF